MHRYLIPIPEIRFRRWVYLQVKDLMDPVSENIYCIGWTWLMMTDRVIPSIVVLEMASYVDEHGEV